MWRAIMMSIGLCLVILGGEAMVVDRVVLADSRAGNRVNDLYSGGGIGGIGGLDSPYSTGYDDLTNYASGSSYGAAPSAPRVIVPPEWAPWGLLSAGVLTFLYATALPIGE